MIIPCPFSVPLTLLLIKEMRTLNVLLRETCNALTIDHIRLSLLLAICEDPLIDKANHRHTGRDPHF